MREAIQNGSLFRFPAFYRLFRLGSFGKALNFKKHLQDKVQEQTKEHDRIRLLEDRDGDGKADSSNLFAACFNEIVDGTDAGVLVRQGNLWYTNIPHLWLSKAVGSSRVDLQACKLEYSIVSPK